MIFKRIAGVDLPIEEGYLSEIEKFCGRKKETGDLTVINDISDILREDYLNESLRLPDRAMKNIKVGSDVWRRIMMMECDKAVHALSRLYAGRLNVVYPWRGALAFAYSFAMMRDVRHFHLGIARNEEKPDETGEIWMPFDSSFISLIDEKETIVIADPMLATGGSIKSLIELMMSLNDKISAKQFVILSVVSAPEGIFNTLNLFPGIKIITVALDWCLNGVGYIVPGLGDAGDKFFDGVSIEFFRKIRFMFSDYQWAVLKSRIVMANFAEEVA